jgi:uncharacterized protein
MSKVYYSQETVNSWVHHIIRSMYAENWKPDYIVGLTRGGLVPAIMFSHYMNIPMHTLNVSLRDNTDIGPESNLWMAEDAFGYNMDRPKKILIVDDINDSGATLNWVMEDWRSGCLPQDERWNDVWNNNVRFAVMINNEASNFKSPDYVGKIINKAERDEWVVFPWEEWWR